MLKIALMTSNLGRGFLSGMAKAGGKVEIDA